MCVRHGIHVMLLYENLMNVHFFLTKSGAGGFPEIEDDHVIALFTGGTIREGDIKTHDNQFPPRWMQPTPGKPHVYLAFIRTAENSHFDSELNTEIVHSIKHKPYDPLHNASYAEVRLRGEHFTARRFQLHERPRYPYFLHFGNMPLNNHIYITLPHGFIYASPLERFEAGHRPF